jgi:hypothetical protein
VFLCLVGLLGGCAPEQPAPGAVPHPYPQDCPEFKLSGPLCALAVEAVRDSQDVDLARVDSIALLGDPCKAEMYVCSGGGPAHPTFVVRVRFTMADGTVREDSLYCGQDGVSPFCEAVE